MGELNVGGRKIHGVDVKKFALDKQVDGRPWSNAAADAFIDKGYRNDNLFLTDGKDAYVVSKRGLNPDRYLKGAKVMVDGKPMTAFRVNDNVDTFRERVIVFGKLVEMEDAAAGNLPILRAIVRPFRALSHAIGDGLRDRFGKH